MKRRSSATTHVGANPRARARWARRATMRCAARLLSGADNGNAQRPLERHRPSLRIRTAHGNAPLQNRRR
eukprot:8159222-Pyramimonas_sp.AAC.1